MISSLTMFAAPCTTSMIRINFVAARWPFSSLWPTRPDTPSALQRILTDAIQSLEPGPNELPESRSWRIYDALFYRYVRRHNRNVVADQLGISARQLGREQRAALDVLAECLWKEYALNIANPDAAFAGDAGASEASPDTAKDLTWLKDAPPEKPTDVRQELPAILNLVRALARQYSVEVTTDLPDAVPQLSVDPVAFRETLLNLLCAAIPRASGGQVIITAKGRQAEVELTVGWRPLLPQAPPSPQTKRKNSAWIWPSSLHTFAQAA